MQTYKNITHFIFVHFGETYRLIIIIIWNTSPVLLNIPSLGWKCYVSKEYGNEWPYEISVLLRILVQSRQKEPHLNCLSYVKTCSITYFQNMWFIYHSRWSNNKPIDRKTFFEPYWEFFLISLAVEMSPTLQKLQDFPSLSKRGEFSGSRTPIPWCKHDQMHFQRGLYQEFRVLFMKYWFSAL